MVEDREEEIQYGSNCRLSVKMRDADYNRYENDNEAIILVSK